MEAIRSTHPTFGTDNDDNDASAFAVFQRHMQLCQLQERQERDTEAELFDRHMRELEEHRSRESFPINLVGKSDERHDAPKPSGFCPW